MNFYMDLVKVYPLLYVRVRGSADCSFSPGVQRCLIRGCSPADRCDWSYALGIMGERDLFDEDDGAGPASCCPRLLPKREVDGWGSDKIPGNEFNELSVSKFVATCEAQLD